MNWYKKKIQPFELKEKIEGFQELRCSAYIAHGKSWIQSLERPVKRMLWVFWNSSVQSILRDLQELDGVPLEIKGKTINFHSDTGQGYP